MPLPITAEIDRLAALYRPGFNAQPATLDRAWRFLEESGNPQPGFRFAPSG